MSLRFDERDCPEVFYHLDIVSGEVPCVRSDDAHLGVDVVQEEWEHECIGGCSVGDGDCERRPSVVDGSVEFDEVLGPIGRMGEPAIEELGANAGRVKVYFQPTFFLALRGYVC